MKIAKLIILFFPVVLVAQKQHNIGISYGYPQYYGRSLSTDPTIIRYTPNWFQTGDLRNINIYYEQIRANGKGYNIELGLMEFWSGYMAFLDGPVIFGHNSHSLVGRTIKFSGNWVYEKKLRWLLFSGEGGLSYYYNFEPSQYASAVEISDFKLETETNPIRNHILTAGLGASVKYPFKRFKFGMEITYNQSVLGAFVTEGPYSKGTDTGYYQLDINGSHSLIEFLVEYQIK